MAMDALQAEGITPCRQTVWRFWCHYQRHGSILPLQSGGRPRKLTEIVLQLIDAAMMENDETTAKELCIILQQHGVVISLCTILRGRKTLGWSFRGAAYCQLIRDVNKMKSGLVSTLRTTSKMWSGRTKHLFNLKLTGAFVAVRMDKNHVASHAPSTQSKYMYGLESAGEVARRFAYL